MLLKNIYVEQIIGSYKSEGFTDKVEYNLDRYNVEMRSALSTHEFSVTINHLKKEISGDVIRYGSWDDLIKEEILEILEVLEKENEIIRPYEDYKILD